MKIKQIYGYEMLDSRSNPTVGAKVVLENGTVGFALSPSGASTGKFEAFELRDTESERYIGKGVLKAVESVNAEISKTLIGEDVFNQKRLDKLMIEADGTENKSRLGANAILAVSLACANAAANALNIPLYRYLGGANARIMPRPMMNILNGGAHASNNVDIQEFMIVPVSACCFAEGLRKCSEIYHNLGKILKEKGLMSGVGDEGGFAPDLSSDEEAIELILTAIDKAGYSEKEIKIALDAASSEWYSEGRYYLPKRRVNLTSEELVNYFDALTLKYPIISLEDGLAEEDFEGWRSITERIGNRVQLVGDDLFVTNPKRLKMGFERKIANSILIKPNQIGTLSETLDVINTAKQKGYTTVISHRSGETEDTFIADLSVAVNAGQIKTGAPCRSDRVAKYNRLLMIENEIMK